MPVIKSARKKLRKDLKREKANNLIRKGMADAVKAAQKRKTKENILKAIKLVDKAAKKRIIHKNKAARIKSALSKLVDIHPAKAKAKPQKVKAKKTSK